MYSPTLERLVEPAFCSNNFGLAKIGIQPIRLSFYEAFVDLPLKACLGAILSLPTSELEEIFSSIFRTSPSSVNMINIVCLVLGLKPKKLSLPKDHNVTAGPSSVNTILSSRQ